MGTLNWLRETFAEGYDSGDILAPVPSSVRLREEVLTGGSYRDAFHRAVFPYLWPNSVVLEMGPGKGSWTRAILQHIPEGRLETIDFVDVRPWLKPEEYGGRLVCHQAEDFSFSCVGDGAFDFFFSFGVLCHHTIEQIQEVLTSTLPKMKRGGVAVHHYGDWEKFLESGRMVHFPSLNDQPDTESWWPSNNAASMAAAAEAAGWRVINPDINLFKRDGLIVLKAW